MIDRRGFIGLLLGAAVAPKDVLNGFATPAPILQAIEKYQFTWVVCNDHLMDVMKNLEPGALMAMEVEIKIDGISQEDWDARQKPGFEVKAEPA